VQLVSSTNYGLCWISVLTVASYRLCAAEAALWFLLKGFWCCYDYIFTVRKDSL